MEKKTGTKATAKPIAKAVVKVIESPSLAGLYRLRALTATKELIGELPTTIARIEDAVIVRLDAHSWGHHAKDSFVGLHAILETAFPGKHILVAPQTVEFCELVKEG